VGLQYDLRLGPPFCGYGRRKPPWWEPWVAIAVCFGLVMLGYLWGRWRGPPGYPAWCKLGAWLCRRQRLL